ncbi:translation initiation factor IF-2-like [Oreochromis aureus]|uniref:translation initiation factor IF-2-like n=1 Tax=Oreochromis aureus TaxID=47969 RepID=UPI0019530F9D|nr:translation initiation factor IF-2-like [Oreochromis aureus]
MAGPHPSQGREELAQIVAEMAATQWEQAAEVRCRQEELLARTERHLGRIAELATVLQAWATPPPPPPPARPDGGEAVEEPRQPEVVDEARRDPHLLEEGEQPGEGLLQPRAVEEPLQPEVADEARRGLRLPVEEEPCREGLLPPGAVVEPLQPEVDEALEGPCPLEVEVPLREGLLQLGAVEELPQPEMAELPVPGEYAQPGAEGEEQVIPERRMPPVSRGSPGGRPPDQHRRRHWRRGRPPEGTRPCHRVGSRLEGVGSAGWLPGLNRAMGVCGGAWSVVPCGRTCMASAITPS